MNDYPAQERRIHKRFQMQEGVFLVFLPDFDVLGQVKNVSNGGVCFEYLGFASQNKFNDICIDIFTRQVRLQLKRLPCRIVFDIRVPDLPTFSRSRRCGLQFLELTQKQTITLQQLCKKYAIKYNPARETTD
ncbi:MAG: PilZ domain-containing protein [Desulfobacteraceae bacterium]|nr:PilZ domain-containing protein [Desulfobacteraceae bacterium]